MKDDPYHDRKKYHLGIFFRDDGGVTALCFRRLRKIDLTRASWTLIDEAVTCKKCLKLLKGKQK